ncbi:Outer membrane protein II* [Phocoenobacter uteri]|uniref:Outer membrane protein II n=1 Tax=Phocoenobacter uteri TaxID=146806 RepID=A0A379C9C2_9PAST|nr:OmpA family protein [Phocoenobacter uteri]MDG6882606.1 hypothetical protein [Phocoenobacter uteri]SUB58769.1 Outer membrane protein II* [Phocoenobacter uteri]
MKKFIVCSLTALCLSACSSNGGSFGSSSNGKLESWTTFDGNTVNLQELGDKQSKVYFYREKDAFQGPAVNVFIDGDYLASVLDGGYRAAIVCSAGDRILPSFTRNTSFADRDTGVDYNFVTGETEYVKIMLSKEGQPIFQRVSQAEGEAAVSNLKQETQTLPRVKANRFCDKAVLDKFTLQAHSLFKFDKSSYKDMLPEGREEIKEIARKINLGIVDIKNIKVVGYTDPMGDDNYNLALSKRRAKTVRQALLNSNVQADVEMEGLGERNLLVRDCLKKYPHDKKARRVCDQPNRRVEIIIYGNRNDK